MSNRRLNDYGLNFNSHADHYCAGASVPYPYVGKPTSGSGGPESNGVAVEGLSALDVVNP